MDPKLLSQLWEVVQQGSLSRAAMSLHVTQPTLTRNMKAIEEAVGAPVLRRGRYGVTPTNLGERLSEQGRIINSAMTMADETVEQWRTGLVGEVKLGVGAMMSASLMPGFFAANPMKDSKFTVRVVAGEPTDLMKKLRSHEIDMAIVPSYSKLVIDKVMQEVLFTDDLCVIAGSQSPLIDLPGQIKPQLLASQTWIAMNSFVKVKHAHDQAAILLGIERVVPKFRFDGDVTAPLAMLRNSNMLALAPRQLASEYVAMGGIHILNIDIELPKRDIVLRVSKENEDNACVMELSSKIKHYFSGIDYLAEPEVHTTSKVHAMELP